MHARRTLVSLLLLAATAGAANAGRTLPLDAGIFTDSATGATCDDGANAAKIYFNGMDLQGPRGEACRTTVTAVSHDGKTFATESACEGVKGPVKRTLMIRNRRHFQEIVAGDEAPREFHRCAPFPRR